MSLSRVLYDRMDLQTKESSRSEVHDDPEKETVVLDRESTEAHVKE